MSRELPLRVKAENAVTGLTFGCAAGLPCAQANR
jgi:hypothetical protein